MVMKALSRFEVVLGKDGVVPLKAIITLTGGMP